VLQVAIRRGVRGIVRVLLAVYFRRIESFHPERAPAAGPVLFVSNHPGSLTDAFIIGTLVARPVSFVATVKLFRLRPVAWLLRQCGVIPVNRRSDDPKAMHTVADTFKACFEVLERGGAVGIFPEGVTYDDARLREVKAGAARIALELEERHDGALGLRISPVGLTYAAKERYRSDVLVHFGESFLVADFLAGYREAAKGGIRALGAAIEQRLRALILDLPALEQARIVLSVKRLYLDRLRVGNLVVTEPMSPRAEELVLSQAIARALAFFEKEDPDRLARFVRALDRYEERLQRLGVSDERMATAAESDAAARGLRLAALALGAPVALYGWLHRLVPILAIDGAVRSFTIAGMRKAQTAQTAMLAGLVAFGLIYGTYILIVYAWLGSWTAFWYALSLPATGLFAHYYVQGLASHVRELGAARVFARVPLAIRLLLRQRAELIGQIEAFRAVYRDAHFTSRP
jgi:1-acyl-sn-glycerol-3-phosphate acyltransferase